MVVLLNYFRHQDLRLTPETNTRVDGTEWLSDLQKSNTHTSVFLPRTISCSRSILHSLSGRSQPPAPPRNLRQSPGDVPAVVTTAVGPHAGDRDLAGAEVTSAQPRGAGKPTSRGKDLFPFCFTRRWESSLSMTPRLLYYSQLPLKGRSSLLWCRTRYIIRITGYIQDGSLS